MNLEKFLYSLWEAWNDDSIEFNVLMMQIPKIFEKEKTNE